MKLELTLPEVKELDEAERKAHNAAIFAVFPRIEQDINRLILEQLETTYRDNIDIAKTREEIVLATVRGNGIMEGAGMLLEKWRRDAKTHEAESQPKEQFNKHEIIGSVD